MKVVNMKGCLIKYDRPWFDGKIIHKGACKNDDGKTIPIVAKCDFHNPDAVVGYAKLETRDDGVYYNAVVNRPDKIQDVIDGLQKDINQYKLGMYALVTDSTSMTDVLACKIGGSSFSIKSDDAAYIEQINEIEEG